MKYIQEAYDTNWVAPLGPNVNEFENDLAKYMNARGVAVLASGTAAIHLALIILGIKKGDEVICSSFTFSASANPIMYQGATPVFIDSETDTWNMDPELLERAIMELRAQGAGDVRGNPTASVLVPCALLLRPLRHAPSALPLSRRGKLYNGLDSCEMRRNVFADFGISEAIV